VWSKRGARCMRHAPRCMRQAPRCMRQAGAPLGCCMARVRWRSISRARAAQRQQRHSMPKRDDVWRRKCGTQKYGIQRTTQDRQHMPTRKLTTYDRQHTELQQEARRLWQWKRGKVDVEGQPPRLGEHRCRRGVAAGKGRFARCNHRISNGSTREQSARAAAAALPRVLCSN
jgi:hypothetical protein